MPRKKSFQERLEALRNDAKTYETQTEENEDENEEEIDQTEKKPEMSLEKRLASLRRKSADMLALKQENIDKGSTYAFKQKGSAAQLSEAEIDSFHTDDSDSSDYSYIRPSQAGKKSTKTN